MYLTLKYLMIQRKPKPLSSVKIIIFNSLMKIKKASKTQKTGNVNEFTTLKGLTKCKPIFQM